MSTEPTSHKPTDSAAGPDTATTYERAKPAQAWIFDMQEQAVSVATEDERRTAMALADDWITKYGKKKN